MSDTTDLERLHSYLHNLPASEYFPKVTEAELECHPYWKKWRDTQSPEATTERLLIAAQVYMAKQALEAEVLAAAKLEKYAAQAATEQQVSPNTCGSVRKGGDVKGRNLLPKALDHSLVGWPPKGPNFFRWYEGKLHYTNYAEKGPEELTCSPTPEEWARFWKVCDQVKLWSWQRHPHNTFGKRIERLGGRRILVRDGLKYKTCVARGWRRMESEGQAALLPDEKMILFHGALQDLVGGPNGATEELKNLREWRGAASAPPLPTCGLTSISQRITSWWRRRFR